MNDSKVVGFPRKPRPVRRVWSGLLQAAFPVIYRHTLVCAPGACALTRAGLAPPRTGAQFSLSSAWKGEGTSATCVPIERPEQNQDFGLLVRHYWTRQVMEEHRAWGEILARLDANEFELVDPALLLFVDELDEDEEFEFDRNDYLGEFFTLEKCAIQPEWGGPRIFYLGDGYDDDEDTSNLTFEASIGIDGILRKTSFFHLEELV